jgi:C4-dicarboxylate transporter DctM subunit
VSGVLALFVAVMGGIYLGIFTASEAAGIGAFGAFMIAFVRRRLTWRMLYDILVETARMTCTLFLILFGALLFSNFVNIAGLPADLQRWIMALGANQTAVLLVIVVMYFLMGMVIESISMMLLTVPVFYPLVVGLGVDPIWFGVFVVVAIEISLITPPVGLNVFVLKTVIPDVPSTTVFRGVAPFVAMDVVRILLLIWVPWLALVIPSTM